MKEEHENIHRVNELRVDGQLELLCNWPFFNEIGGTVREWCGDFFSAIFIRITFFAKQFFPAKNPFSNIKKMARKIT
jgi:hypothetical protein